jgi:hypothetical protein
VGKNGLYKIVYWLILTGTASLYSQNTASPQQKFGLSGDVRAEFYNDGITGKPQNRPENIHSIQMTPSLAIPGLPQMNFSVKMSSLENGSRQPFNRFGLQLVPRWGSLFLGDSYPVFSKYTLNGILLRGFSSDMQLGVLRLAVAAGQSKRAIEYDQPVLWPTQSYKQSLYGAKIGLGKKDATRLNFNLIKIKDDSTSADMTGLDKPRENLVAGFDGVVTLFKNKLKLTGEFNAGAFSRDIRAREWSLPSRVPAIAKKIFTPRASSQYDIAGYMESAVTLARTLVTMNYTHIGPDFNSLGTAYLHNDIRKYSAVLAQRLWRNRLFFSAGLDRANDNLKRLKKSTARSASYYVSGSLSSASLPAWQINFRRHTLQNNDVSVFTVNNRLNFLQSSLSQNFHLLSLYHTISLSATQSWYRSQTFANTPGRDYDLGNARASINTALKAPVTFFLSAGYMKTRYLASGQADKRWLFNAGITHKAFKGRLNSYFSFNYDEGKANEYYRRVDQDTTFLTTVFSVRKRTGFVFRSDWKSSLGTFSAKIEKIVYHTSLNPQDNYREFIVRLIYSKRLSAGSDSNHSSSRDYKL